MSAKITTKTLIDAFPYIVQIPTSVEYLLYAGTQPFRTFEEAQKYLLEHLCYSRVFQLKDKHVACYEVWEFAVLTGKEIIGFMPGDVDEFETTHKTTPLWVRARNKEILKEMQMRSRK